MTFSLWYARYLKYCDFCFNRVTRTMCFFFNDSHNFLFIFVALSVAAYTNLGHACFVIDCNTVGILSLCIVPLLAADAFPFQANRLLCFYTFVQTC
jgi:hypothetical protein